jgi:hypothetical protein
MISGWFVRLTLIFAVLAVGAFDGISILVASVGVKDDAQSAAQAAATAYQQSGHSAEQALAAAKAALSDGETIVPGSVHAATDGTISLKIHRTAKSIVLHLWSTSAKWDVVTGTASALPSPS